MNSLLSNTHISTKDASALSGYNPDYLGRLCREGKISASQLGRAWLIERESLESFIAGQAERRIELAEQISREREEEYRRANPVLETLTPKVEQKTTDTVNVVMGALARVRFPKDLAFTNGQAFATAMTALVLGASVTLAGSGVVAAGTTALLASALEGRALAINSIVDTSTLAQEKRAQLAARALTEISSSEEMFANAKSDRFEDASSQIALGMSERKESPAFASLAYVRSQEHVLYSQSTTTFGDVRGSVVATVSNPAPILSSFGNSGLRAYADVGAYILHDVDTLLAVHVNAIESAGNSLLAVGTGARDAGVATPSLARNIMRVAVDTYGMGLYSYVGSVERVPRAIVSTLYGIGDSVSNGLATSVVKTPEAYSDSINAYTDASIGVATGISDTSYAVGKTANETVSLALSAQDHAIAAGVRSTRNAIADAGEAAALSVGIVSGTLIDQGLGIAGTVALNVETMGGNVLPASALASLDTSAFFPSFLRDTGSVLAEAARSMMHGVFGPLAGFFDAAEEVGIAVIPIEAVFDPETSSEQVPSVPTTIVYNDAPVTVVNNTYSTVAYDGVPQSYVDGQVDRLERIIVGSIDNSRRASRGGSNNSDGITSIDGMTGTGLTLNSSTWSDGFINGAILDVLDTIVSGTLSVNGHIEATDYIAGPYVLATSTTATSAFSGNIAVGRNATLGTSPADLLTVNSSIGSSLLSAATNTYDIGSSTNIWRRGYFGQVIVNGLADGCVEVVGGQLTSIGSNCGTGSGSISSLNGLTASSQTFASADDTNIGLSIVSTGSTHTFTSTWIGTLAAGRGGTGISSIAENELLIGGPGNTWNQIATSSLGLQVAGNYFLQGGNSFGTTATLGTNDTQSLGFETDGVTRITVLANGNVGIGTSTPLTNSILDMYRSSNDVVRGSITNPNTGISAFTGFNILNSGSGINDGLSLYAMGTGYTTSGMFVQDSGVVMADSSLSGGLSIGARNSSGNVRFYTGGSADANERMTILSGGNVGISTSTPWTLFSLDVALNDSDAIAIRSGTGSNIFAVGNNSNSGQLLLGSTNGTPLVALGGPAGSSNYLARNATDKFGVGDNSPDYKFEIQGTTGNGYFGITDAVDGDILTINASGNVGIGTTTPSNPLLISKNQGAQTTLLGLTNFSASANASADIDFKISSTDVTTARIGALRTNIGGGGATELLFSTYTGSSLTEKMRILGNGNVGIGTTSPQANLHITGGSFSSLPQIDITPSSAFTTTDNAEIRLWGDAARTETRYVSILERNFGGNNQNGLVFRTNFGTTLTDALIIRPVSTGANIGIGTTSNSARLAIKGGGTTTGTNFLTTNSNNIALFSILDSGNVGIGTANPTYKLQLTAGEMVLGDAAVTGTLGNGNLSITGAASSFNVYRRGVTNLNSPTPGDRWAFYSSGAGFHFYTEGTGDTNIIKPNGDFIFNKNVGIGTTSPYAKLSITGSGTGTGVTFQTANSSNTPTFTILDNGNIGINTIAGPFFALEAHTPTNGSVINMRARGGNNVGFQFSLADASVVTNNFNKAGLFYVTDGTAWGRGSLMLVNNGTADSSNATVADARLTITSTGNVGIGTTSPVARLAVKGIGIGTNINFQTTNSSDTPILTVLDSGRIGIGTDTPANMLTVSVSAVGQGIALYTGGNLLGSLVRSSTLIGGASVMAIESGASNRALALNLQSTANIIMAVGGGNVGIGTTSPTAKLSVDGDLAVNNILPNGPYTGNMSPYDLGSTTKRFNAAWAGTYNVGTSTWSITTKSDGSLAFFDQANGAGVEQLTLNTDGSVNVPGTLMQGGAPISASQWITEGSNIYYNTGSVGVGTSTPSARLAVAGLGTGTGRAFAVTDSTNVERLTVLDNGNIGIGIANPTDKLTINGASIALSEAGSVAVAPDALGGFTRLYSKIAQYGIQPSTTTISVATTTATTTYTYTGSNESFVVPAGTTSINVKMWGAAGGSGSAAGGAGAYVGATIAVTPGETITFRVGGGGGGGTVSGSGGGGGRSDTLRGSAVLLAAGAGGGNGQNVQGGAAGAATGSAGQGYGIGAGGSSSGASGGAGGSNSAGGSGGNGNYGGGGGGHIVYEHDGNDYYVSSSGTGASGTFQTGGAGSANAGGGGGGVGGGSVNNGSAGGSGSFPTGGTGVNGAGGGGGGGGYGGGGGGGYYFDNHLGQYLMGGGGGGASFATSTGTSNVVLTAGSGQTPGNSGDADRGTAGSPVSTTNGNPGKIVVSYLVPATTTQIFDPGIATTTSPNANLYAKLSSGLEALLTAWVVSSTSPTQMFFNDPLNGLTNLGIGTTNPSAKLAVSGNATSTGKAFVVADSANTERLTVLNNGNIGIGVSNPDAKLAIETNGVGSGAALSIGSAVPQIVPGSGGATWTARTASEANQWTAITYGNDLFVAVSNNGTNRVMTSPDGITWTARTAAAANSWSSVTYGNGLFVAVSFDGTNRVMTSPDGITWTARSAASASGWISVTYGNGLFVAVGAAAAMTSPDGITWTSRTPAVGNSWVAVTYGNGLFVAVSSDGSNNHVMTSPDGITWTSRTPATAASWRAITHGNGTFVAVSQGGHVMTSSDGITWTSRTAAAANVWIAITHGNGTFVAVSNAASNSVMTSSDGITWTARTAAQPNVWYGVAYGNGTFAAVSYDGTNRVMTSSATSGVNNFQVSGYGQLSIGNTSTTYQLNVGNSGISGAVASFTNSNGTCTINPNTTSLSCSSDARLKKNVVSIASTTDALSAISMLSPVFYNWNKEGDEDQKHAGFLAQELQQILPDLVMTDESGYLSVNYAGLTPYLASGIQQLNARTSFLTSVFSTASTSTSTSPAIVGLTATTNGIGIGTASTTHMLTVAGAGSFTGSVFGSAFVVPNAALEFLTGSTTASTTVAFELPLNVLTADGLGADLYKMGVYALYQVQNLTERTNLIDTKLERIENRLLTLESATSTPDVASITAGAIQDLLAGFEAVFEKGIAAFNTLVFRQLAVAEDENGFSSAGSVSILAGNTVAEIENPYVLPSSKIFITFTSAVSGTWYVSEKQEGKFRITLSESQSGDTTFDYFILQSEGQLASPQAATIPSEPDTSEIPVVEEQPVVPIVPEPEVPLELPPEPEADPVLEPETEPVLPEEAIVEVPAPEIPVIIEPII